ncbi:MAG: hypothetical protein ACI4SO_02830 [Muribaculaceae bacterium]
MNLDELKQSWQSIDSELKRIEKLNDDLSRICQNRNTSLRDELKNKYRALWLLCLLMTVVSVGLIWNEAIMPVMATVLIFYFAILGVLNYIVYKKFKALNYNDMTVKEMLISVTNIHILRSRYKIVGYCMMTPVIIALLWRFYTVEMAMFYGGCVGGVVGLIAGIITDRKIERQIRELKENLEHELDNGNDE